MNDFKNIKKQSKFCAELMERLNKDIQEENKQSSWSWGCMNNKSQKQMDIIRLRREWMIDNGSTSAKAGGFFNAFQHFQCVENIEKTLKNA